MKNKLLNILLIIATLFTSGCSDSNNLNVITKSFSTENNDVYHIQISELGFLSSILEMIDDNKKIDQIIDYYHDKDIKFEGQVENDDIGYIENNYTIYFSINTKDKTKKCARYIILDDGTIYYHLFSRTISIY